MKNNKRGHGKAQEGAAEMGTATSTSSMRRRQESVSVALENASVTLTHKQLEFMERLDECPGFYGTAGEEYLIYEYASELSDTMNSMTVGAVVTTLREKGLITTSKHIAMGIKYGVFSLTSTGWEVYDNLSNQKFLRNPRTDAHWVDNADSYKCSNCGYEINNPNKGVFGAEKCPKCFAVMHKGGKDDD